MAIKPESYVDTSAFIAFLDRSDSYHTRFGVLFSSPPSLVTSSLVIAEGHGWFLRRYDHRKAAQFLAFIESLRPLRILAFGSPDIAPVKSLVNKFADRDLTLADAHGLSIMRERRIASCWSTDRHLALDGARLSI